LKDLIDALLFNVKGNLGIVNLCGITPTIIPNIGKEVIELLCRPPTFFSKTPPGCFEMTEHFHKTFQFNVNKILRYIPSVDSISNVETMLFHLAKQM